MKRFIVILLFTALLSSCTTKPTSMPISTNSPVPASATPVPVTETPAPTATPIPPTPTIEPPSIISEYLNGVKILSLDAFDNLDNWGAWNLQTGSLKNGTYEITGQEGWMSGLVLINKISEGNGLTLKFKLSENGDYLSEFVLATGAYQTDSYRQFGIYTQKYSTADLYQGTNGLGFNNLNGNLVLQPEVWYNLMMAVGDGGDLIAVIWNPDDPTNRVYYHEILGKKWDDLNFEFQAKANIGQTYVIDDFMSFTFTEIVR
jgi:hypothetical protein